MIQRDRSKLSILQPLSAWTCSQITRWMAVVGLGRFIVQFERKKITGSSLLKLVPFSATLDQVVDPLSRQALRRAILVRY